MTLSAAGNRAPCVLYLSSFADLTRGGQNSLLLLLRQLDRDRYRPALVVPGHGPFAREAERLGVPVHEVPWPKRLSDPAGLARSVRLLRAVVRDTRPSIIHADSPRNAYIALFAAHGFRRMKRVLHIRVGDRYFPSDLLLGTFFDALVAISLSTADRFKGMPAFIRRKIRVIYNGVDTERFRPVSSAEKLRIRNEYDLPLDRPVAGMFAGFVPVKRHLFLLEVWKEIAESNGGLLILAGKEEGPTYSMATRFVREHKLEESVRFMGFSESVERLMVACDVTILPSSMVGREREGFGRVLIEAGACGVPAVAADLPGVREAVVDGSSGLLVPPYNRARWFEALSGILKEKETRLRMGRLARERILKEFSARQHTEAIMKLYNSLVNSRRSE